MKNHHQWFYVNDLVGHQISPRRKSENAGERPGGSRGPRGGGGEAELVPWGVRLGKRTYQVLPQVMLDAFKPIGTSSIYIWTYIYIYQAICLMV